MTASSTEPPDPSDDDILWRYLPAKRFEQLLDSQQALIDLGVIRARKGPPASWKRLGSLWFAGPDLYKSTDPNEGTFPALNLSTDDYCRRAAEYLGLGPEEAERERAKFLEADPEHLREQIRFRARLCGVTCWHKNVGENPQMWACYVGTQAGVVVRTTMRRVRKSIEYVLEDDYPTTGKARDGRVGMALRWKTVKYIDFSDWDPHDGYFHLLRLKDAESFKHENEVRGIARSPYFAGLYQSHGGVIPNAAEAESRLKDFGGFNMSVDLNELLEAVIVSPFGDDAYRAVVEKSLADKSLVGVPVEKSQVARDDVAGFGAEKC